MAADASEAKDADIGKQVMDLLIFLLEDQTGTPYEYRRIDDENKTA